MKYIDEYRNKKLIQLAGQRIKDIMPRQAVTIMEVCGSHTRAFLRYGLAELLPAHLRFISGPGCPVCVSTQEYIDQAIYLSSRPDTIVVTFGDMLRVPGSSTTLSEMRSEGARVQIAYSPLDALSLARANPGKNVVFLAVGFETTVPAIGLAIEAAKGEKIPNIFFLAALKLITPAMEIICQDKRMRIDGFLCPGHVCAVTGTRAYDFIPRKFGVACCIAGFEPLDMMEGIYFILKQLKAKKPRVDNQYIRVVTRNGNPKARAIMNRVFVPVDCGWRGMGVIPKSGLSLKKKYSRFAADKVFAFKSKIKQGFKRPDCRCGDVIKGYIVPSACRLFAKVCNPDNPLGPCMVSNEGACHAYYEYKR